MWESLICLYLAEEKIEISNRFRYLLSSSDTKILGSVGSASGLSAKVVGFPILEVVSVSRMGQ